MLKTVNSILTNQFFLMFLSIATGLLIGKMCIRDRSIPASCSMRAGLLNSLVSISKIFS